MVLSDKTKDQSSIASQKPWWNKPLWGDRSFLEKVKSYFAKTPIPEATVSLHNENLQQVTQVATLLEKMDSEKFSRISENPPSTIFDLGGDESLSIEGVQYPHFAPAEIDNFLICSLITSF